MKFVELHPKYQIEEPSTANIKNTPKNSKNEIFLFVSDHYYILMTSN